MSDGFDLTFANPVDAKTAGDVKSYTMKAWTYIYQSGYGSPEVDAVTPVVREAVVGGDLMSVRLVVDGMVQGQVHHLNAAGVCAQDGKTLWHPDGYYTLNEVPE